MSTTNELMPLLDAADEVGLEETVDPRVQVELERLNTATDLINKLEIELDEARNHFRALVSESAQQVSVLSKKLGSCVEKARPYYDARMKAKQLQTEIQRTALRYERATSAHAAAKEMVQLAEEGMKKRGHCFDSAWQEMLNHATVKVNEAEIERLLSHKEHHKTSIAYNEAEQKVQHLHQEIKRAIVKSRPYFEMKAQFNKLLEEQRAKIHQLEENVLKMKMSYSDALHNLEEISEEIHQKRKCKEMPKVSHDIDNKIKASNNINGIKVPYHATSTNGIQEASSQSNDINDLTNSMDTYLRLPNKISSKVLYTNRKGTLSNDQEQGSQDLSSDKACFSGQEGIHPNSNGVEGAKDPLGNTDNSFDMKPELNTPSSSNSSAVNEKTLEDRNIPNQLSFLSLMTASFQNDKESPDSFSVDPVIIDDNGISIDDFELRSISQRSSPEGIEDDRKTQFSNMSVLRVQKEDFSDNESLASNDTADTLDDHQIECLLLERVLSHDCEGLLNNSDDKAVDK